MRKWLAMFQLVEVPIWILIVICVLAGLTFLDRLLVPSARWFVRRRVNRVLEDRTQLSSLDEVPTNRSLLQVMLRTLTFVLRNLGQMILGRWHRFGYACVNFGSPISMRAYFRDHDLRPNELNRNERFANSIDHLLG